MVALPERWRAKWLPGGVVAFRFVFGRRKAGACGPSSQLAASLALTEYASLMLSSTEDARNGEAGAPALVENGEDFVPCLLGSK